MDIRDLETSTYGTATLGSVVDALKGFAPTATVQFDFCYLRPTTVASYRGYYAHLALGWSEGGPWQPVGELLLILEGATGKTFEGWKGGEYTMSRETPLWVANRGDTGGTGIVGIGVEYETSIVLITAKVD